MEHVQGIIGRLVAKGLMEFEFAHDLVWEFMKEATPSQMQVHGAYPIVPCGRHPGNALLLSLTLRSQRPASPACVVPLLLLRRLRLRWP